VNIKKRLKIFVLAFVVAIVCGGAVYAYTTYAAAEQAVSTVASSGTIADILKPEPLSGESTGVVNILIAGNSSDDANHGGAELTDSIMVARVTVSTGDVSVISIPRDLWVSYEENYSKINAVYTKGGIEGLAQVVTEVTGLTINHKVLVNYAALKEAIDVVGGIDITIESPDTRGIYDPMIGFSIGNGLQHLSGEQALLLARSRNDPTYDGRVPYGLPHGDFDRQMYQRRIIQALFDKVGSSTKIVNPTTLTKLFESLSGNVSTDLSVGQIRRLYDLSKNTKTVASISLQKDESTGTSLLVDYRTSSGQAALMPTEGIGMYSALQQYIASKSPVTTTQQ
jgi:LCP family protein required for cell wall assembly